MTVAITLPRRRWTWKILALISAVADVVEMSMHQGTTRYFYVWWGFRIVELLWLAFATCHLCSKLHPNIYTDHFHWTPFMISMLAVVAAGRWETDSQMQMLQSFILITCALPAWLYAFLFWSVRILPLALGVLIATELACAFVWRYFGYHVEGWFVAWILGMTLLWIADREDRLAYSSS